MKEKNYKIQNSMEEDDLQQLEILNNCVSDIENEEDEFAARKSMARYNLEGGKPKRFFCKMNKKNEKYCPV